MKNHPSISIVMAVYNGEQYLKECLDSIIVQTYANWELVIINDGSIDNSKRIIEEYSQIDERIIFVNQPENKGLVHCLNTAIEMCRGQYLARMDCDDVMYPDRLEIQFNFMEQNKSIGVLGSWIDVIDSNSKIISSWKFPEKNVGIKRLMLSKCPFMHPTVFIRKDVLPKQKNIYSKEYPKSEDYELWIRLSQITEFYNLQTATIKYRVHPGQITQKSIKAVAGDNLRLIIDSVLKKRVSLVALAYLWKPLFYVISPKFIIDLKIKHRDRELA